MAHRVLLAGQDITASYEQTSIKIESALGQGAGSGGNGSGRASTCTFLTRLGPAAQALGAGEVIPGVGGPFLVRQGLVQIYDANDRLIFTGYATYLRDKTMKKQTFTEVECHDLWQDLDRVIVNETYTSATDTAIIRALLIKYAPWIDRSLLPAGASFTFPVKRFKQYTLQNAIQSVADATGYEVFITPDFKLHYASPAAASSAPFGLSSDLGEIDFHAWFTHRVDKYELDDTAIINRVYFYGGTRLSDNYSQDCSSQCNGVNKYWLLAYAPEKTSDGHVHVKVNGVEAKVGYEGIDALIADGGTFDVLINTESKVAKLNTAYPAGTSAQVIYRYNIPLVLTIKDSPSFAYFGRYYDGYIADTSIYDLITASQRSRALLAQQKYGLLNMTVTTWTPGLQAGMLVRIKNLERQIDGTFQVQKVTYKPLGAGNWEYQVDLGAWQWNVLDLLTLAARNTQPTDDSTDDSNPVQADEREEAVTLAASFTYATRTSGQYYARSAPVGDGHDAYPGYFSITS